MNAIKSPLIPVALLALAACQPSATPVQGPSDETIHRFTVDVPGLEFPTRTALQLKAWGVTVKGQKIDLTSRAEWTSLAPDVARVGPTGIAQLDGTGVARFEARYETFVVPIEVKSNPVQLIQLSLSSSDEGALALGEARRFTARAWFDDGSSLDVTDRAIWTSDGRAFDATDVKGQIVARREGVGQLRASYFAQESAALVTVDKARFVGVSMDPPSVAIKPGDVHRLSLFANFSDGSRRDVSFESTWSSTDLEVIDVSMSADQRGVILARGVGPARITARWNDSVAQLELVVVPRAVVGVGFDAPQVQIALGRATGLDLIAELDDGSRVVVTNSASFISSQPTVASVSNGDARGQVSSLEQGVSTITAWYAGFEASYELFVAPPELDGLAATITNGRIAVGQVAELMLLGRFTDGSVLNLTPAVAPQHGPGVVSSVAFGRLRIAGAQLGTALVDFAVGPMMTQVTFDVSAEPLTSLELIDVSSREGLGGPTNTEPHRMRAIGVYADGLRVDITELCTWWVDDASVVVVSDEPGTRGEVDLAAGGTTNLSVAIAGNTTTLPWAFPARP